MSLFINNMMTNIPLKKTFSLKGFTYFFRYYYVPPVPEKLKPKLIERTGGGKIENRDEVWADAESSNYTKVKEVKGHWHFVERLKPKYENLTELQKITPYPSIGNSEPLWKPPADKPPELPYSVNRTKNNMLPVYFTIEQRGPRPLTKLKNISGDIWILEKDLKIYLEAKYNKEIDSAVHEVVGFIKFKGNFQEDIKNYLYDKGF